MNTPSVQYKTRYWEEVEAGEVLPSIHMGLTLRRSLMIAAATRDFFPGHHDRDYARAQGMSDAWGSTYFIEGLVDRIVTDWSGPDVWIRKRQLRIRRQVYVGTTIDVTGKVEQKYQDAWGNAAQIVVTLRTSDDPTEAATARVWLLLPSRTT